MTTKAFASALGGTRSRQRPFVQQLSTGSIVTASTSKNVECATTSLPANNSPAINRLLACYPVFRILSHRLYHKRLIKNPVHAVCVLPLVSCITKMVPSIDADQGTICSGSHRFPLSQSTITASQSVQATSIGPAGFTLSNSATFISSGQQSSGSTSDGLMSTHQLQLPVPIDYPRCNKSILKRIPKGARPAAANLLSKLIRDVLQHPLSKAFCRHIWQSQVEVGNRGTLRRILLKTFINTNRELLRRHQILPACIHKVAHFQSEQTRKNSNDGFRQVGGRRCQGCSSFTVHG
jgi:hypothetical protein